MLLAAEPKEFLVHLKNILMSVEEPELKDPSVRPKNLSDTEFKKLKESEGERVLLKQSLIILIGNLCCET
jgi:hypothetical protein